MQILWIIWSAAMIGLFGCRLYYDYSPFNDVSETRKRGDALIVMLWVIVLALWIILLQ